jgi:hypothetical protein
VVEVPEELEERGQFPGGRCVNGAAAEPVGSSARADSTEAGLREATVTEAPAAAAAFAMARPTPLDPPRTTTRLAVEMAMDLSRLSV